MTPTHKGESSFRDTRHCRLGVYVTPCTRRKLLVPTARASTRHAIIREIICHFAGYDCAKLGHQNKLHVSSGVLSDRQDEDISFATSTHHGQVTVEPFSVEERRDRLEHNETKARMKEGPKFHLLLYSLDDLKG